MNRIVLLLLTCSLSLFGDEVWLNAVVRDYDNNSISGVDVCCRTQEEPEAAYAKIKYNEYKWKTDDNGKLSVAFPCYEGYAHCLFCAKGYYSESRRDIHWTANFDHKQGKYVFDEKEKDIEIKMRGIRNPQEMVFHRLIKGDKRLPARVGRFGFDVEKGDWVRPEGKGSTADIYVTCNWKEDGDRRDCAGVIEFVGKGCGAYVRKQWPCKLFPVDYSVDANAVFVTRFPFSFSRNLKTNEYQESNVMQDDEYMVIRSRVKMDDDGKIVEANYSQIHGPIRIGYYFSLGSFFFNPRVNDLNLEYVQPR